MIKNPPCGVMVNKAIGLSLVRHDVNGLFLAVNTPHGWMSINCDQSISNTKEYRNEWYDFVYAAAKSPQFITWRFNENESRVFFVKWHKSCLEIAEACQNSKCFKKA